MTRNRHRCALAPALVLAALLVFAATPVALAGLDQYGGAPTAAAYAPYTVVSLAPARIGQYLR
jgi:hypothetical protein